MNTPQKNIRLTDEAHRLLSIIKSKEERSLTYLTDKAIKNFAKSKKII